LGLSLKPGFAAREAALHWLLAVTESGRPLDEAMEAGAATLAPRDRAFAHLLAATTLRRHGEIDAALKPFLAKPLPRSSGPARAILSLGMAQLQYLKSDPHAAIDLGVELAKSDPKAKHFSGLINAVLRKAASTKPMENARLNMPPWLFTQLEAAYGADTASAIAEAHMHEAPLDISVKGEAASWAHTLNGVILPTGTIRIEKPGASVQELPGYADGYWWVQDAAAALPVHLLGDVRDKTILDLCAAPGGKTMQLASRGAHVTAVDDSSFRMKRLRENLQRLKLEAECIVADMLKLPADKLYDCVLLDAPCSATGTMRRHPDLAHLRTEKQVGELESLQARMLDHAAKLVQPGGLLVYCVCSLLRQEGEDQVKALLKRRPDFSLDAIKPEDVAGQQQFVEKSGFLRCLPHMHIGQNKGLDGFFAARLRRH
jgi:16S rRNA (cytosine967-C5)-methyltransferase